MTSPLLRFPADDALPSYYHGYLHHARDETDILAALEAQAAATAGLLEFVSPDREQFRYAPGKWSVREVVGHVVDTERVFQLRALWFARGDAQALPGYDENAWGDASGAGEVPLSRLLEEYAAVRRSTLLLFSNLDSTAMERVGEANGQRFQAGAIPWFLLGHERHHLEILRERYGV